MSKLNDKIKSYCATCNGITNHIILHVEGESWADSDEGLWSETLWQTIKCNGCDNFSFRTVMTNSDDYNHESDEFIPTITLYPKSGTDILSIKTFYNAPYKIRNIYREMIDAFNNGLFLLCSGGLRSVIDGICNEENIKDGPIEIEVDGKKEMKRSKDLQGKISGLHENGLLTKKHAALLHEHRVLGNEALHSLDQPAKNELKLAIEIIEHTLENLYELSDKGEMLRAQKSKRKPK